MKGDLQASVLSLEPVARPLAIWESERGVYERFPLVEHLPQLLAGLQVVGVPSRVGALLRGAGK